MIVGPACGGGIWGLSQIAQQSAVQLALFKYVLSVTVERVLAIWARRCILQIASLMSKLSNIPTLQNLFRSAPLGHTDHSAADLFRGQNVIRKNTPEQLNQKADQNVAETVRTCLGALSVKRLNARWTAHVGVFERKTQERIFSLAFYPRPHAAALLGGVRTCAGEEFPAASGSSPR